MTRTLYDIVFIGLSLSSSWGNGHATTYRSLLRGLAALGQSVLFLERDVPWYRNNRDLPHPDFCDLVHYGTVSDLETTFAGPIKAANHVIVGSYVPEGVEVIDIVNRLRDGETWFYDIDTPVTLATLARNDQEYLAPRQIPELEGYFSFAGGPALTTLENRYGAKAAFPLYCAVDADRYRPTGERLAWDMGYLGTYSADRQPALERLLIEPARRLPHMRFVVAGPQYPTDIDWPDNVERIDHLPPTNHPSFYSRQRFTLNITRQDMIANGHSPSVRLFEAAACGTPVISDRWDGLDDLFPNGRAILLADDSDDVVSLLLDRDEDWRLSIADAARSRVLAGHTGKKRAQELLFVLGHERAASQARSRLGSIQQFLA